MNKQVLDKHNLTIWFLSAIGEFLGQFENCRSGNSQICHPKKITHNGKSQVMIDDCDNQIFKTDDSYVQSIYCSRQILSNVAAANGIIFM